MRTQEQRLALVVLLGCLAIFDVAPPELAFDRSAVSVETPLVAGFEAGAERFTTP